MGRLPSPQNHLANAAHCLGIRGNHAKRTEVVQDIFGGDGFAANAGFSKGHIFGNAAIQVVTHHQHIQVFFQGVGGVGPGGIGGRGQHVGFAANLDDVRRVATARPFGVISVNGAILEGIDGGFHKPRFIQGVGVDRHLHIVLVGDAQAGVDGSRSSPPVFVQFQAQRPGLHLFNQSGWLSAVAFTQKTKVEGEGFHRLQHTVNVPGTWGAGGCISPCGRAGAAANHGGHTGCDRSFDLLGTNEVDVGINAACSENHPFPRDRLGAGADRDIDIVLNVGITCFADFGDAPVFDANIRLDNAPPIQNQGIGDDGIHRSFSAGDGGLGHAIANRFAAAELHLVAVGGEVLLYLDQQFSVG